MARTVGRGQWSNSLDLGGSQVGHKKKQERVGGDVQVEIDKGMHEEAGASQHPGEPQGSGEGIVELSQALPGFAEQGTQKPDTAKPSQNAGFGEGFEIVVVRVIDDLPIVE